MNTGLAAARGKLVYIMADYMYLHPRCLERHWAIYQEYGPKVFISGPLVDDFVYHGWSWWQHRAGRKTVVTVGDRQVTYEERLPPIHVPIRPRTDSPNLLSIWRWPVQVEWPEPPGKRPIDWRMAVVGKHAVGPDVYQADRSGNDPNFESYWWCGRNDSAPLELLLSAGGLDESQDGVHGGLEAQLAQRMLNQGARYLFDNLAPAAILPHPSRKAEAGWNKLR